MRKKSFPSAQIEALDRMKFNWNISEARFKTGINKFKEFVDEFGHARVVTTYETPDGYKLVSWVRCVRKGLIKCSEENRTELDSLNFLWDLDAD